MVMAALGRHFYFASMREAGKKAKNWTAVETARPGELGPAMLRPYKGA
jgi:hypothetical protein